MTKFEFEVQFQQYEFMAECQVFPIDGSTELHVVLLNSDMFESFGQ